MRIGINGSGLIAFGRPASEIVAHAVAAEADGFASYWLAQLGAPDALTVLGVVGPATSTIELGTAVISTWPRHPLMLAAQALTVSDLAGGRVALGIGLAHKSTVESTLHVPFERPARHMDEYLSVLLPALAERRVSFRGEIWSGDTEALGGPTDVRTPSVLLAAMGPRMLDLAGGRADGTILWLSGPRVIEAEIAPALTVAADRAARLAPRIVASVPVCVTGQPDAIRGLVAAVLASYNDLPSYRRVMDLEGAAGPEDVALIGDEDDVRAGIERFAAAGATEFAALEVATDDDEVARTRALLRSLAAAGC
ncbi:MAG: TIGR03564 family F420-dependent LLM class oxidoreductase [Acidimicrobiia bacterium]|jgi:F420-dependent oxidoreductase-like protein